MKNDYLPQIPAICLPLVAREWGEVAGQLQKLAALQPDLIEIRLDYLPDLTPARIRAELPALAGLTAIPLLATCRRAEEGGQTNLNEAERLAILQAVLESGAARLVDIELRTSVAARDEFLEVARQAGVGTVLSYHDFEKTPDLEELNTLIREMAATQASILKLAVQPRTPPDVLNLLAATYEARQWLDRPLVTMAMGALGAITRLGGPFFGSALTFAVGDQSSAPGQVEIDIVRRLWQNWQTNPENFGFSIFDFGLPE